MKLFTYLCVKQLNLKTMCLNLKRKDIKPRIAEDDIIVYKGLRSEYIRSYSDNRSKIKHGASFTGIIKSNGREDIECEGKISIDDTTIFFCTNNRELDGNDTTNKLGYNYSWELDNNVVKIIIDDEVVLLAEFKRYLTPYQMVEIEIGKTYTSELEKIDYSVEKGLHSFEKIEDLKNLYGSDSTAKCIIPKGSTYYIGEFNGRISYASDKLTYVEIIE